uniref:Probable Co/Zn/Cd efflux system membrane fusion protein n=1 Tax=Rheinheimera sp. BAL341 TaxID=1708203 RepID=A0A486XU93_9GAMM
MYQFLVNNNPRRLLVILLLSSALVLALLMFASGDRMKPALSNSHQLVSVETALLTLQPSFVEQHRILAQVEHINVSNLGFDISGTLAQLLVDEGQRVQQGQAIAKLDTERLTADRSQLLASLKRKEAEAELARVTSTRTVELAKKKLVSQQIADEARLALTSAKAAVAETQAAIARLEVEQSKTVLVAPFDGMLQKRYADQGAVISAGQTVIRLQQTGQLRARMAVSGKDASALKEGQKITLLNGGESIVAYVEAVIENKQRETRTQDVLLLLDTGVTDLVAGDTLIFSLPREVHVVGSWVPRSALSAGVRGMWQLMTVVDSEQSFLVQPLLVNIEYFDAERAFVSGVFTDNTQIVTGGMHKIQPDQRVSVQQPVLTMQSIGANPLGFNHE